MSSSSTHQVAVTDEPFDAYFNRPLAGYLVRALADTKVTPNQLTAMSALCGTVAALCFAAPGEYAPVLGAFALLGCTILDCGDGQLARVRGGGSPLGRIFDGYADYWVELCLHVGVLAHLARTGVTLFGHQLGGWQRFFFVLAAGISMGINSGRFDYYKQRWLAHTGAVREPEVPEVYLAEARKPHSLPVRWLLLLFAAYVRTQQGPAYVAASERARRTAEDPVLRARFERDNALLVRLWSLSGPSMHNAVLCTAACFTLLVPNAFVYYCLWALVVVNVYCIILAVIQQRVVGREQG